MVAGLPVVLTGFEPSLKTADPKNALSDSAHKKSPINEAF